jgi:ribonuclease HI
VSAATPPWPIQLYTDRSAWLEDQSGGWAWWVSDGVFDSGFVSPATNNTMELRAVIEGLCAVEWLGQDVEVISDSAYVVNCFKQRWMDGWRKRAALRDDGKWKSSQGKTVANQEIWQELFDIVENYPTRITWRHCRGHKRGGPEDAPYVDGNDKVDRLAGAARKAGPVSSDARLDVSPSTM